MTFEERLAVAADSIETQLAAMIERYVTASNAVPDRLAAAMRHAVLGGGKRIRPMLVVETAAMLGAGPERATAAALALELVHCYSLVHDDLPEMDNDALRRGRPTVWKAFDDWTAILVGDALLTLAFEVLADNAAAGEGKTTARLVAGLARAAGAAGMVGGQCLDLEADKLGRPPLRSAGHVHRLQAMKTGALFRFACQAGAMVAEASDEQERRLARFGEVLGAAFQLADDLLDAEGDAAVVGKATGKDAAAGKATLVALLGVDGSRRELSRLEADGLHQLEPFGPRAEALRAALRFVVARRK